MSPAVRIVALMFGTNILKNIPNSLTPSIRALFINSIGNSFAFCLNKYIKKGSNMEEKILSMYAKRMTTNDIESHMRELYDIEISDSTISRITDKILPIVKEWQERPLEGKRQILRPLL